MQIRRIRLVGLAVLALCAVAASGHAGERAVTLHTFDGTGYDPWAGIVSDDHGNILGTTTAGGTGSCTAGLGCGTVFRMSPPPTPGGEWNYQTLYNFQGGPDGYFPQAPVTLDPLGAVYGYASAGTNGIVFRLLPPVDGTIWTYQALYVFQGGGDGDLLHVAAPLLVRDGHVYGIASGGASRGCGADGCGSVFRLDPGADGAPWTKATLFSFNGGTTGGQPRWIAGFDSHGALFVSVAQRKGAVIRLSPLATPGAPWTISVITTFAGGRDGRAPSDLVLAPNGTLFGLAVGTRAAGDLVYRLTPPATNPSPWTRSVVAYVKDHGYGPDSIALGRDGTLIGAIEGDFDFFAGSLFQLTPPASGDGMWTFSELWNFNRGPDRNPLNAVIGRGGHVFSILNGGDSSSGSVVELR